MLQLNLKWKYLDKQIILQFKHIQIENFINQIH